MTRILALALLLAMPAVADEPPAETAAAPAHDAAPAATPEAHPMLDTTLPSLANEPVDMSRYRGKVLLVVNVASKCGYTPQYEGLQALHEKYAPKGLAVLGFPANDFGAQEPGTNQEIAGFCRKNFGVTFDMFSKISVLGEDKHPVYGWLTTSNPAYPGEVKWNFEKFLVGKDGKVVGRFGSKVKPDDPELVAAIEKALAS